MRNHFSKDIPRRPRRILFVILITGLTIPLVKIAKRIFTLDSIHCSTIYGPCPQEALTALNSLKGENTLFIKRADVAEKITRYKITGFFRRLPNQLRLEIEVPKPSAVLRIISVENPADGLDYLVSQQGVIIGPTSEAALPVVEYEGSLIARPGELVNDFSVLQAIKLAFLLNELGYPKPKIRVEGKNLILKNISSAQIILSSQSDPEKTATTLQQVLTKATMSQKIPTKIDLRFNQPVIVY